MIKSRVLVVADNDKSLLILSSRMEADGYEVEGLSDPDLVFEKVDSYHPDLILLEITVPKSGGFEICSSLKSSEDTRYIPVIILTAGVDFEDKVMGLEIGAEDYISKPYSLVEVSARVKSLIRMRQLQSKLRESVKMAALGSMVDDIAHEIRNPLVTIGGLARRLFEHETNAEHQRYASTIMSSVMRLEKMMGRIDEYKGILVSKLERADINDVIGRAVNDVKDEAKEKGVVIMLKLMADPHCLEIDPSNLKVALSNLLQNAIEAVGDEKDICVSTHTRDEGHLTLVISDKGCGMDEVMQRKVFSPFFTSKTSGAGLGIAISHRIIKDHGGEIGVKSRKGEGSTFTITLPLRQ